MKQKEISASQSKIACLMMDGILDNDWYIINPNHNQNSTKKASQPIIDYLKRKGVAITP